MKKLMVLASVMAIAVAVNAGSCVWGFAGYDYLGPNGEGYDSEYDMNLWGNGKAYLFLGAVTASETAFDISKATYVDAAGYDAEGLTYGNQNGEARTQSSALPDSVLAKTIYTVIMTDKAVDDWGSYEGNYVMYTGEGAIIADPVAEVNYGDFTYSGAVGGAEGLQWQTMSNVPEPTSGLLLLLGVAGLALRRRRA